MNVKVYNQIGEEQAQAKLPKEVFGLEVNDDLVHQVIVGQMSNQRQGNAHTKQRGEVRGGGRKPWRQKGTGRARVGSNRSPIWRGGGITFGPRNERNYKKTIPTKMRRKAMFMVLSAKVKSELLLLIDTIKFDKISTKEMNGIIGKLPVKTGSVLIVLPKINKALILSTRNIPKVDTIQAKDLNALDLMSFKYVVMPKESVKVIEETFVK